MKTTQGYGFDEILEAAPHKTAVTQILTSFHIQVRRTIYAGPCLKSKDEIISDFLLWTYTKGLNIFVWPEKIEIISS